MKLLLAFLLAFGLACAPAQLPEAKRENPVAEMVARSVFLEESGCSAVQVTPLVVATAKHCLPDDAKVGDEYEGGTLTHVSAAHDFALFARPVTAPHWAVMRPAQLGEHVYVVGWPQQVRDGDQQLTVTDGLVAGPVSAGGEARITAPAYYGNSGGGVWADDGSLVGILVSGEIARVDGYRWPVPYLASSYMVPIAHVRAAL